MGEGTTARSGLPKGDRRTDKGYQKADPSKGTGGTRWWTYSPITDHILRSYCFFGRLSAHAAQAACRSFTPSRSLPVRLIRTPPND